MAGIPITDVTTSAIDGTGALDHILRTVTEHVSKEYSAGRVEGSDYATVYLGSLQTALSESIQFILSRQASDKQAELLEAQRQNVAADTALKRQQLINLELEALNIPKQGLILDKQLEKLEADIAKAEAETLLLRQKMITEIAQVADSWEGVEVGGVIKVQKDLQIQQKETFIRESEQRAMKLFVDSFNVRFGSSPSSTPQTGTGLEDDNIKRVANKVMEGIGATPLP